MKTMTMAMIIFLGLGGLLFAQHPVEVRIKEAAIMPVSSKEAPKGQSAKFNPVQAEEKQINVQLELVSEAIQADSISTSLADSAGESDLSFPAGLELGQNYPNPFNSDTEIKYGLPVRSSVHISVYNIFGQKVRTIKDDIEDSGYYSVNWDGRDDSGDILASGMYFYVFASDDNYLTRKMMFLK